MKLPSLLAVSLLFAPLLAPVSFSQSVPAVANPDDAKNCADSPAIPRPPNSTLTRCASKPDASLQIPVGKEASGSPTQKTVSGESQELEYKAARGMTADQIFTALETIVKNAGFTVVFEDSPKLISATKQSMWCEIQTTAAGYTETIVNSPRTQPASNDGSLTAEVLNRGGRVPIKGIHFDDKGAIADGSDDGLSEITALLTRDPSLKIRIEAYAFNASDSAGNLFLSQKEAQSVTDWLTAHGVDRNRISPQGLGAATPIEEAENGGKTASKHEVDIVKVQ